MTVSTFDGNDVIEAGHFVKIGNPFATIRAASSAGAYVDDTSPIVEQYYDGKTDYTLYRAGGTIDGLDAAIGSDTVSAATLAVGISATQAGTGYLVPFTPSNKSAFAVGDFDQFSLGSGAWGSTTLTGFGSISFTLNATGRAAIEAAAQGDGMLSFGILAEEDYDGSAYSKWIEAELFFTAASSFELSVTHAASGGSTEYPLPDTMMRVPILGVRSM